MASDSDPDPVNRSRLLTFKLGGTAKLPDVLDILRNLPDYSHIATVSERVERGHKIFESYCAACHGTGAVGGGVTPDLRFSGITGSDAAWKSIVYDGALQSRGMVGFKKELSLKTFANLLSVVITMHVH